MADFTVSSSRDDVLLSHVTPDKAVVEGIARRLEAFGIRCFLGAWNCSG